MDTNKKIEDFKNLWLSVSEGNEDTMNFYCKEILKDADNIVSIYEGDTCVATLSTPEMKFNYEGEELSAALISSFAIHPDYRHNNYELDIQFNTLNHLYKKGITIVCSYMVSPKLKSLYKRRWQGMITEARKVVRAVRPTFKSTSTKITVEKTTENIEAEYNALIKRLYRNYVIHSSASFDLMRMNGDFFLAKDAEGRTVGVAIRLHYSETYKIDELVADSEEGVQVLIEEICKSYNWEYVDYECYDKTSKEGMGNLRIVNAQRMLDCYAQKHPEWNDLFNIDDQIVVANCGSYRIESGSCRMIPDDPSLRTITITNLNEMLFEEYNINLGLIY